MRLEIWCKIGLFVFAQHYALIVVHATIKYRIINPVNDIVPVTDL